MRIETDAAVPTARGAVTVGPAFAGPPGFVHGGIVAGLLDEAIGWLASATVPDAAVVTGKLSVRFRSPTPVDEPLELQVVVTKHSSRSMHVNAEILANGEVTARGEALMVVFFLVLTIGLTHRYLNRPSAFNAKMAENSYYVYLVHYPVILVLRLPLLTVDWPVWRLR